MNTRTRERRVSSATDKARYTARWAETLTKYLVTKASEKNWQVMSFRGPKGGESRGIVDMIAIRKDHKYTSSTLKSGDRFNIVLIQIKGGTAPQPSKIDNKRICEIAKCYHTDCILAKWKKGYLPEFSRLAKASLEWNKTKPQEIFK